MASNSGRALQRMMVAGGLVVAGGVVLLVGRVAKVTSNALQGRSAPEDSAAAEAPRSPQAASASGVIHVEDGDPLPPATPLGRSSPAHRSGETIPAEMSREQLVREVIDLRARVAALETQLAYTRSPAHDGAGSPGR